MNYFSLDKKILKKKNKEKKTIVLFVQIGCPENAVDTLEVVVDNKVAICPLNV